MKFAQTTAHIEKANIEFLVLIRPYNESTAQYFHEILMPTLATKNKLKLGLLAEKKANKEDNPELRYLVINKFDDINMGYKYSVSSFEDGNHAIKEINYIRNDMKPIIDIYKSRLDTIPYDDNDCMIGCKCNKCKH